MTANDSTPDTIVVFVGDSPEQCVTRALAACKCRHPENHHLYAPDLLKQVKPNDGGEPSWPFVLVIAAEGDDAGDGFDQNAEGVRVYTIDRSN